MLGFSGFMDFTNLYHKCFGIEKQIVRVYCINPFSMQSSNGGFGLIFNWLRPLAYQSNNQIHGIANTGEQQNNGENRGGAKIFVQINTAYCAHQHDS